MCIANDYAFICVDLIFCHAFSRRIRLSLPRHRAAVLAGWCMNGCRRTSYRPPAAVVLYLLPCVLPSSNGRFYHVNEYRLHAAYEAFYGYHHKQQAHKSHHYVVAGLAEHAYKAC